jgi:hypothetical protein
MCRRINLPPVFFTQPLEIKDGQRLRCFKSVAEYMRDLLSDRSVLALRSSLKLLVQSVGKILNVEDRHSLYSQNSSIVEELAWGVKTIARE